MLDKFMHLPNRGALSIVLLLGALLVGVGLGTWATASFYETRLERINQQLGACANANTTLIAATKHQNKGVTELQAAGVAKTRRVADAVASTRPRIDVLGSQARAILGAQKPLGRDLCESARADFDAELKRERGAS